MAHRTHRRARMLATTLAVMALVAATAIVPAQARRGGDRDRDGLRNAYELNVSMTDPADRDSDDDRIADGKEDEDGDGLRTKQEAKEGTDPLNADSDDDGLDDGDELDEGTDPNDDDSDDDGIEDGDDDSNDDGSDDCDDADDHDDDDDAIDHQDEDDDVCPDPSASPSPSPEPTRPY